MVQFHSAYAAESNLSRATQCTYRFPRLRRDIQHIRVLKSRQISIRFVSKRLNAFASFSVGQFFHRRLLMDDKPYRRHSRYEQTLSLRGQKRTRLLYQNDVIYGTYPQIAAAAKPTLK